MKEWKKLLLCISVSILILSSITMIGSEIINYFNIVAIDRHEQEIRELAKRHAYSLVQSKVNFNNDSLSETESNVDDTTLIWSTPSLDDSELDTQKQEDAKEFGDFLWYENAESKEENKNKSILTKQNEKEKDTRENKELKEQVKPKSLNEEDSVNDNNIEKYGKETMDALIDFSWGAYRQMYCSKFEVYKIYLLSVLMGIVSGFLAYLIFIKKIRAKKVILISVLIFIGITIAINIGDIFVDIKSSVENRSFDLDFEYYFYNEASLFFIIYMVILVIVYVSNLIYQKKLEKKLNKELKKKTNLEQEK